MRHSGLTPQQEQGDASHHTDFEHAFAGLPKSRVLIVGAFFFFLLFLIMVRLCIVCLTPMSPIDPGVKHIVRGALVDRNGYFLASSLDTFSIYAHPNKVADKEEAIAALMDIFPSLDRARLRRDMHSKKSFIWISRHVAPHKKMAVKALGIDGLDVLSDSKRIYPMDRIFCHVLGTTDLDQQGLSGLEKSLNQRLMQSNEPVRTSFDLRVQNILYDALSYQISEHSAVGGNGIIVDLRTGEILAMVSLPDFSPSQPICPTDPGYFNRNMTGVYEFGSIMKIANTALLLESKKGTLRSVFDASKPLRIGRHLVKDFRGQNRPLNVEEAFVYSSNIAHAKMAAAVGGAAQKQFFEKMGFSRAIKTELGLCARPLFPKGNWPMPRVMTAGYGYGFAVTPLHVAASLIPLATGILKPVTFLASPKSPGVRLLKPSTVKVLASPKSPGVRLLKPSTVKDILYLMGQAVANGQAKKAAAINCVVGAKTGTANVRVGGRYVEKQNLTSAVAVFPLDCPRYGIVLSIDRAKASTKTYHYATAGWMAAPVISRLVQELAPLLGVMTPETQEKQGCLKKANG
jgi:cell division protein FtsI (penicillin-binding protein 3)